MKRYEFTSPEDFLKHLVYDFEDLSSSSKSFFTDVSRLSRQEIKNIYSEGRVVSVSFMLNGRTCPSYNFAIVTSERTTLRYSSLFTHYISESIIVDNIPYYVKHYTSYGVYADIGLEKI